MHLWSPFVVSDIRYEKQEPTLYQARKQNTTAFPNFTFTTDIIEINRFFFSRKDDDCSCSELVDMAKFNWSNSQKGHAELPQRVCFFFFLLLCDIFRKTGNRRRNTTGTFPRKWVIALPLFWGHMIVVWLYQPIKDSHFHFRIVKIFTRAYNSSQWNPISRSCRRRARGYIEYNTWALVDMEFLFECLTRFDSSRVSAANEWDVELNTRREIPYLQATTYYFAYHI